MKTKILVIVAFSVLFSSCTQNKKGPSQHSPLNGTWQLVFAEAVINDSVVHDKLQGNKMIKIITNSHFAFLNHDLKAGKDSAALFVAGGGTCTLHDSIYSETLEYCNYRDWEGLKVDFKFHLKGDTLILSGHEKKDDIKVNQFITEKYIRIGD